LLRTKEKEPFLELDINNLNEMRPIIEKALTEIIDNIIQKTAEELRKNALDGLVHDIRNPLAYISAVIDLLKEQEKLGKYSKNLIMNLEYLNDLIDSFQNSLYDLDELNINKEKLAISNLLEEVLITFEHEVSAKNHEIKIENKEKLTLFADERQMKRVIKNLLSNAIKYTPDNGLIIIKASNNFEKNQQEILVKDNGYGLTEEQQGAVFNKFTKVHQTKVPKKRGLGLGLWLCKEIIERHNGKIAVYSEGEMKGTEFTISLPYDDAKKNLQASSNEKVFL
jgi:signal transduction histidine kinase